VQWQPRKINCSRTIVSSATERHMQTNSDKETTMGGTTMISTHALSGVILKVLSFSLAAGVLIFVGLLLLTLRHA
jgi:hypothetical protein